MWIKRKRVLTGNQTGNLSVTEAHPESWCVLRIYICCRE